MNLKFLNNMSYIYLILPIIIFLIGWIKPIIAIPFCIAIIYALYIVTKNFNDNKEIISKKSISLIFLFFLIICILAGQGGLFYQSNDHHWRNAIFRDLINEKWPVYYEISNTYLDYYIAHWLVPASIAKMFLSISETVAWNIGNILLLFWSAIGVTLTFLWIINGVKNKNKRNIIATLVIFIFFSGLDIVGVLSTESLMSMHIEWWNVEYQFSSMITQLFWVFNQSIASWLIIMLFLKEKDVKNYFLLIILFLPYAPLPFLGAIPLFACNGFRCLYKSIKDKKIKGFWKDVFSFQNIVALVCILPIYYFYYSLNQSTMSDGFRVLTQLLTIEGTINLLLFWFIEVGIYGIFLWKTYKKSPLFWVAFIGLILVPIFAIGSYKDFSMRGSIPFLMVCMIFVIDLLINRSKEIKKEVQYVLIILLIIGAITPGVEFARAIKTVVENKKIRCVADDIVTFSDKTPEYFSNFLGYNKYDTIFIKYLINK